MMWIVCNNIFVSNSVGGYVRNFAYSGPLLLYETHQLPICYTCTLPDPFFLSVLLTSISGQEPPKEVNREQKG